MDRNRAGDTSQRCGNSPAVSFSRDFVQPENRPVPLDEDGLLERARQKGFADSNTQQARYFMRRIGYSYASDYFPDFSGSGAGLMAIHQSILLDRRFQSIVLEYIGLFELQFRAQYSLLMSQKNGAFAHRDPSNFKSRPRFESFLTDYGREVNRQLRSGNVAVTKSVKEYGDLPLWQAVNVMTFGTLSKLYKNTRDKSVRMGVADSFGVHYRELASWMQTISYVRNRCAHFGRVLGNNLVYMPRRIDGVNLRPTHPFYVVLLLERLLSTSVEFENDPTLMYSVRLATEMGAMISATPQIIRAFYIPINWKSLLSSERIVGVDMEFSPFPTWRTAMPIYVPDGNREELRE